MKNKYIHTYIYDNCILLDSEVKYSFHSIFFIPLRKYCSELLRKNYYLFQFYNTLPLKNCQSMFKIPNLWYHKLLPTNSRDVRSKGREKGVVIPLNADGEAKGVFCSSYNIMYYDWKMFSKMTVCFYILAHQHHNFKDSNSVFKNKYLK